MNKQSRWKATLRYLWFLRQQGKGITIKPVQDHFACTVVHRKRKVHIQKYEPGWGFWLRFYKALILLCLRITFSHTLSLSLSLSTLIKPLQNFYFFSFSNLRRPLGSCSPFSQPHHLTWFPHPPPDTHANLLLQLYALLSSLDLTKTCMVLFMLWTNKDNNTCL